MEAIKKERLLNELRKEISNYNNKVRRLEIAKQDITLSRIDIIEYNTRIREYKKEIERIYKHIAKVQAM